MKEVPLVIIRSKPTANQCCGSKLFDFYPVAPKRRNFSTQIGVLKANYRDYNIPVRDGFQLD
jgi:hypothetical protein